MLALSPCNTRLSKYSKPFPSEVKKGFEYVLMKATCCKLSPKRTWILDPPQSRHIKVWIFKKGIQVDGYGLRLISLASICIIWIVVS